jgi:hypothetical protein
MNLCIDLSKGNCSSGSGRELYLTDGRCSVHHKLHLEAMVCDGINGLIRLKSQRELIDGSRADRYLYIGPMELNCPHNDHLTGRGRDCDCQQFGVFIRPLALPQQAEVPAGPEPRAASA